MTIYLHNLELPCGSIVLGDIDGELCISDFTHTGHHLITLSRIRKHVPLDNEIHCITPVIATAVEQINEYIAGNRTAFNLPLRLIGSPFQIKVWRAIMEIPFGCTVSYSALAQRVGEGRATRAVANAVGCNPLPIVVPCHRVVTASGGNSGFSGGLPAKEFLQQLENCVV